jgi:hypothetical protein
MEEWKDNLADHTKQTARLSQVTHPLRIPFKEGSIALLLYRSSQISNVLCKECGAINIVICLFRTNFRTCIFLWLHTFVGGRGLIER